MEIDLRTTGCRLPYGITHCNYLSVCPSVLHHFQDISSSWRIRSYMTLNSILTVIRLIPVRRDLTYDL